MEDLLANVLQLCPNVLDISSLVALSLSSRNLRAMAFTTLQQNTLLAELWLLEAVEIWKSSGRPRFGYDWEPIGLSLFGEDDPESAMAKALAKYDRIHGVHISPVLWLFTNAAKAWGIMQLASCLNLQGALIAAAGDDKRAADLLIAAGARVTEQLIVSAALTPAQGIPTWLTLSSRQGLRMEIPPFLTTLCHGTELEWEQLDQLSPMDCYIGAAVALSQGPSYIPTSPQEFLLQPQMATFTWSQPQLLQLLRAAVSGATANSNKASWSHRWTYPAAVKALLTPFTSPACTAITSAQLGELMDSADGCPGVYEELLQQLRQRDSSSRSARALFHLCKAALQQWDTTTDPVEAWLRTPAAKQLSGAEIATLLELTLGWVFLEWDCSCWGVVRALLALPAALELPAETAAAVLEPVCRWGQQEAEGTLELFRDWFWRSARELREQVLQISENPDLLRDVLGHH